MRPQVWLLDASIYIFRAYFALPDNWRAANGMPTHALIAITANPINWYPGFGLTVPTATVGIPAEAGSFISWLEPGSDYSALIRQAQFIRSGGADATLFVIFFA